MTQLRRIISLTGEIAAWSEKKDESNDSYDEEICEFHLRKLEAQKEILILDYAINCCKAAGAAGAAGIAGVSEIAKVSEKDEFDKVIIILEEKYTALQEIVTKNEGCIVAANNSDALIGKAPLSVCVEAGGV